MKQLEFEFRKDYERNLRREELERLWKNVFKPTLITSSVILPIYFGALYLIRNPEYIGATKEYIKSLF